MNRNEINSRVVVNGNKVEVIGQLIRLASGANEPFFCLNFINDIVKCFDTVRDYGIETAQTFYFNFQKSKTELVYREREFLDSAESGAFEEDDIFYEVVIEGGLGTINQLELPKKKEKKLYKVVTYHFTKQMETSIDIAIPNDDSPYDHRDEAENYLEDADWEESGYDDYEFIDYDLHKNDCTAEQAIEWGIYNEREIEEDEEE